jgi:protein-disulfide isomerase
MPRRSLLSSAFSAVALLLLMATTAVAAPTGAEKTAARFAGIEQHGRTLGKPKAPVTITFFHEIKCPFCRAFDTKVLPKVIKRYVRTGRVKIVAYPQVFPWFDEGADSRRATRFAVAIGQQRLYWNFIDLFYANQLDESETYATDAYLAELAAAIPGADSQRAFAVRDTAAVGNVLLQSEARMDAFGVLGVPTLFVSKSGAKVPKNSRHLTNYERVEVWDDIKSFDSSIRKIEKRLK